MGSYIYIVIFIAVVVGGLAYNIKENQQKSKKEEEIKFKEYKRKVERERREAEERAEYLKKQGEINEARRKRILQEQLEKQERRTIRTSYTATRRIYSRRSH